MRRWTTAAAIAVVLVAAAVAWRALRPAAPGDGAARVGAADGFAADAVIGSATARPPDPALDPLARAYAALGAADDAGVAADASLPEALAAQARELLALDRAHAGAGRATTAPGTRLAIGDAAAAARGSAAGERVGDAERETAGGEAMTLAADAPLPDPAQALAQTPDGPVLRRPGLWADARFRPDAMPRGLRVVDASGGGYVVRVMGTERPERLRLDGGLVVPGRYYRVNGAATLVGDVPASLEIRPLAAVPVWHDAPPAPPHGSG